MNIFSYSMLLEYDPALFTQLGDLFLSVLRLSKVNRAHAQRVIDAWKLDEFENFAVYASPRL
jgi:hypothetical protein